MNDDQQPNGNPWIKSLMVWGGIFMALLLVVSMFNAGTATSGKQLRYSDFRDKVAEGSVREVQIGPDKITGVLDNDEQFSTVPVPSDTELTNLLQENGVKYAGVAKEEGNLLVYILIQTLPFLLILGVAFFALRHVQKGGGSGAMGFGKSKAKLLTERQGRVTFDDVAGIDEAREELEEIVEFLKDPQRFSKLGGQIPKGALLVGSPGTGKTLLARAIAGEAGVPFFTISGSDFVEMFVGVGASRVRDMFEQAKKNSPCIVFIDEIDAVGRHRGHGLGNSNDEREQTLNQLLVEMDGFESNEGVIIMAATNRPDVLDPALLRPGRFDRRVTVDSPDVKGRRGILEVHVRRTPLAEDVDLDLLAKATPGMSGADLENMVNEAALLAARHNKKKLEMDDFEEARDKIWMGPARRSRIMSDDQKKRTAYHEAGHALLAVLLPGKPLHKVTIVPRGRAGGLTWTLPAGENQSRNVESFRSEIAMAMGGRAAEKVIFQEINTGASQDIKMATNIARAMVTEYGMSDELGPVHLGGGSEVFLGRDYGRRAEYSEATARLIDQQVRKRVEEGLDWASRILLTNIHILHKVAQVLLEKETLDGDEFHRIVAEMDPVLPAGVGALPEPA